MKKGVFARAWVMDGARNQPAYMWWDANGASCPELQYVARIVLSQPASASICERINSEFAFVRAATSSGTPKPTSWWRSSTSCASSTE